MDHVGMCLLVDFSQDLARTLIDSKVTSLGQLLEIAGRDFKKEEATAQRLGFRSIRLVAQLLVRMVVNS